MVEGTSDVALFGFVSELHRQRTGHSLVGVDLSIFAAGYGDEGGTYGICEQFPTLLNVIQADPDQNGKLRHRLITLLDNDEHGRVAAKTLSRGSRRIRVNANVFLLRFHLPRASRDEKPLTTHIATENAACADLDCELEDLFDPKLLDEYERENSHYLVRRIQLGSETHRDWTSDGKRHLQKYAQDLAVIEDCDRIVETLKSLRFYLGLPVDGTKASHTN